MNNDLVTIVVPTYNAEPFLRENIESVIKQSYWNLEIIYVCDGCTDHTVKILQEYAVEDARIKVVVERENHGAAVSRNIGMDMASGEWIIFWDSDDIFHVQTIETMVKTAIRESADVVCCYWECFEEAPKGNAQIENAMRKLYCETYPVVDTDKEFYQIMQLIDNSPCTKLVHKSIYRKREIFFQDIPNANDVYYAMVIAINSHKIVYADKPFLYIRMNKNRSTISTDRDLKRSYILEAMDKIYEYIMSREDSALLLKSFYNNVIYNMIYYQNLPVYGELLNSLRNIYFFKWGMKGSAFINELSAVNKVYYLNMINDQGIGDGQNLYMQAKVELVRELSKKGCSIWGAGAMGRAFLEELSKAGVKIQHVFDSAHTQWGKIVCGYVVENFEETQVDHIIITTPKYYDEIAGQIGNRVEHIHNPEKEIWLIPYEDVL